MPGFTIEAVFIVAGFVLPGAVSMFVYGLRVPQRDHLLKDRIFEAVCFSLLNAVIWAGPIFIFWKWVPQTIEEVTYFQIILLWGALILVFVVAPAYWPFLLVKILRFAEKQHWIGVRARTAWDAFFDAQRRGCWIQIVLNDGSVVGGRFDKSSYASAFPDSGHLYIEELWEVDDQGSFVQPLNGQPGAILRPGDYKLIMPFTKERQGGTR